MIFPRNVLPSLSLPLYLEADLPPKMSSPPSTTSNEKKAHHDTHPADPEAIVGQITDFEAGEVFRKDGEVNFRTVGWPRASVIFLKIIFATGVLSIPTAMVSLGAVGGALNVIGWGALNTYTAVIQGDFRNRHPGCHSIADMAKEVGGVWMRVGFSLDD